MVLELLGYFLGIYGQILPNICEKIKFVGQNWVKIEALVVKIHLLIWSPHWTNSQHFLRYGGWPGKTSWEPSHQGYTCGEVLIFWHGSPSTHYTPSFREMWSNCSDYAFNTGSLRSDLLKKELILIFLFSKYNQKYNITSSSNKTELYSRDAVLLSWILQMCLFNVSDIIYISVI